MDSVSKRPHHEIITHQTGDNATLHVSLIGNGAFNVYYIIITMSLCCKVSVAMCRMPYKICTLTSIICRYNIGRDSGSGKTKWLGSNKYTYMC